MKYYKAEIRNEYLETLSNCTYTNDLIIIYVINDYVNKAFVRVAETESVEIIKLSTCHALSLINNY